MPIVSITGATGFIGQHLIRRLLARPDVTVRALAHSVADTKLTRMERLVWLRGDLADIASARGLVEADGVLVNLAFPGEWHSEKHLSATAALAQLAIDAGVRRVIHCSTAVLAGSAPARRVTESTIAAPTTRYEQVKLAIEEAWIKACRDHSELAILRPTAVFGPAGRNLVKLADALNRGMRAANYVRSSLFGRRRMNLVHVSNVVAAIEFLLERPAARTGEIYIVSDDEDPANNFRDVERSLMRSWGIPDYPVPPVPMSRPLLSALLRLRGRSNADPDRVYDGSKLERAGLRKPCRLEDGLRDFASWYASTNAARTPR